MATQTPARTDQTRVAAVDAEASKARELYADAPEMGKAALKNGLRMLTEELGGEGRAQSARRIGARQGKVSELTVFLPFVKGGAKRLRGLLQLLEGNFRAADAIGTVHDMRFVFVDNDTKFSSRRPMTATLTPTSRTSRRRFRMLWICGRAILRVTRECVTRRRRRTGSPSTVSRPTPGRNSRT